VAELSIAIGMPRAFLGLDVGLKALTGHPEHPPDRAGADRVATSGEGQSQLTRALAGPPQRRLGVAANVGINESVESCLQLGVALPQLLTPCTRTPDAAVPGRRRVQILHSAVQGLARKPGRPRNQRDSAPTQRTSLGTSPQAPLPFIEVGRDGFPAGADGSSSVHAKTLTASTPFVQLILAKTLTPHDLRHFYASALIRQGADVKLVQARLGHKSAQTTIDIYGHLWPDSDERTRTAIDAVFDRPLARAGDGDAGMAAERDCR